MKASSGFILNITASAAEKARKGEGPALIECKTYRYFGHSRSDPRIYRTKEEEALWKKRDPIEKLKQRIISEKVMSPDDVESLEQDVQKQVDEAAEFALNSPYPSPDSLYDGVYA